MNIRALGERAPESVALRRYREIARILTGNPEASAGDGVAWVAELCGELGIPQLKRYGVTRDHLAELVEKAAQASSMKANPVVLTADELTEVIEGSL